MAQNNGDIDKYDVHDFPRVSTSPSVEENCGFDTGESGQISDTLEVSSSVDTTVSVTRIKEQFASERDINAKNNFSNVSSINGTDHFSSCDAANIASHSTITSDHISNSKISLDINSKMSESTGNKMSTAIVMMEPKELLQQDGSSTRTPNTPSDTISNEDAPDNNDEMETEELDGESKGRFNLRKRRLVSGSYDGYNDSDMSGQFNCGGCDGDDGSNKSANFGEESKSSGYAFKRKRAGGYSYNSECLLTAASLIKNTGCSVKQAAGDYGIPPSTLHRFYKMFIKGKIVYPQPYQQSREDSPDSVEKVPCIKDTEDIAARGVVFNGNSGSYPGKRGFNLRGTHKAPALAMTALEEHQLATYMSLMSRSGKSIAHSDIKIIAQQIVDSKEKKAFRKGNCPTGGWIQKFKARHPELEYKTHDHALMKVGTEPSVEDLQIWVSDLRDFLRIDWKLDLDEFFVPKNSSRIFTCDEILIAFSKLDDKGEKIPLKSLLKNSSGEEKQLVTVIAAASASGEYLKPHLLLSETSSGTDLFPTLDSSAYTSVHSPTGLITPDIFLQWVQYFDAYLNNKSIIRPVVLLIDDHQAHFHINVFLYCLDKRIIPVCLPPKLNKIIQPLLVYFFPKLMMAYQACCKRYTSKTGLGITHGSFPYIMMKAWTLVTKPKFITEGFDACKLIPMQVTSLNVPQKSPVTPQATKNGMDSDTSGKVKDEQKTCNPSEDDGESSAQQDEVSRTETSSGITLLMPKQKKIFKKRKISKSVSSSQFSCVSSNAASKDVILGDKFVCAERKQGRREGIDMCLSVMESFVPADILPVWRRRASTHSGTCEIGYCMWKAVQLLQQGGLEMAGRGQPQVLQFGEQQQPQL